MTDYKSTLNLPSTDFPMKANLAEREPAMLAQWQKENLYQQLRQQRQGAPRYVLHDGPPYANGNIHIGHAVNKILKDIIVKAKSLSGYDVPFIPGWDCHGLPIELNVEKKIGKAGVKVSPRQFRDACRAYAAEQIEVQKQSFERLGILADWQHPYTTMAYSYEADTVRALSKIVANGHLQQGFKPVHWCLDCASALAEAEVEYQDKTSPAIDVAFKVDDILALNQRLALSLAPDSTVFIPIWTTTPWTLPANEAIAIHRDAQYVLVKTDTYYLVVAEVLLEACLARYGLQSQQILQRCQGEALEHLLCQHPFLPKAVPIILGEHVTLDTGTGAVHTAPAHGQEDYQVGLHYQLPVHNPVGHNGCFLESTPLVGGLHVNKANDLIIDHLQHQGVLLAQVKIQHSFPHCWRHKTPLIFRATPQWFISMDKASLRSQALTAIGQVQWLPDWGQQRIEGMVQGRPDWCISRQRTWGVPIPLFLHKESQALHPRTAEILQQVAAEIEQQGIDAWFELASDYFLGEEAKDYDKCTDILDVWFDSGISHDAVVQQQHWPFPVQLYLEGSDQHRGWFQSSLLTSTAMHGVAPYQTVLTHGFTVDGQGRKMSKSLGNVVAPEKVMHSLGADILRLWVAMTDYRSEMAVSDDILKRTADVYRRIRNTARYLLANIEDFDPATDLLPGEQLLSLDACLLAKAKILQQEIRDAYDRFEFHVVTQKIQQFCSIELGSFYLDICKDRQYTCQTNSPARRSAQTVMYHLLQALTRWLSPILSFTAEEIWHYFPHLSEASVFLSTWYEQFPEDQALAQARQGFDLSHLAIALEVRQVVNKALEQARKAGLIGSGLEAEVVVHVRADSQVQDVLSRLANELRFFFITSSASLSLDTASDTGESGVVTNTEGQPEHFHVSVQASSHAKCSRCWHHQASVGQHADHPELCLRCIDNAFGDGETRLWG